MKSYQVKAKVTKAQKKFFSTYAKKAGISEAELMRRMISKFMKY